MVDMFASTIADPHPNERTSALNADTEAKVMQTLGEVMKNQTTFVIANWLSTCDDLVDAGGRFARRAPNLFLPRHRLRRSSRHEYD